MKVALALSGGGVRAAVFHCGVLQRLALDGLLESTTFVSTVSGGSLVVGLILCQSGHRWPGSEEFLECRAAERQGSAHDGDSAMVLCVEVGRAPLAPGARALHTFWQASSKPNGESAGRCRTYPRHLVGW